MKNNSIRPGQMRFQFAARLAILCLLGLGAFDCSNVMAQKTKPAPYGTLRVLSNPPGLAIEVDGKSYGTTTGEFTTIERLPEGVHTVVVTLPDGRLWRREIDVAAGRVKCVTVAYRPPPVVASSACPFPVNISAPAQVTDGTIVSYSADVTYGGKKNLVYTWTVSPAKAKVISGAGTPTIEVDTTGLAGQRVSATLVVDDGSGEVGCRQIAQAISYIPPLERRDRISSRLDECCGCASDDQKARLDNLAIALQNDPSITAYVIAYSARDSQQAHASRVLTRSKEYLVENRGIDSSRIVTVNGGIRDQECLELWLMPRGAAPPVPKP
jgi:hypothetical protein